MKFEVIPVTQFAQNCSLIWCDETHQAALIDPGGEADKLLAAITKRGLT
ncbi:MBL fold metallo-hydrolase, partial [Escherichia coli]